MSLLEVEVNRVRTLLTSPPSAALDWKDLKTFPKTQHAGLILKSDMAVELGAPERPSAGLSLYSNDNASDSVHLIGRPLEALTGQSVSFAEIVILHGETVDAETFDQFGIRRQRLSDFPGWMVKSTGGKVWVRTAAIDGEMPSFDAAAATFIARVHDAFSQVTGVELWYVTECDELIAQLFEESRTLSEATQSLKEGVWKARGFDYKSCQLSGHCGGCADKKTCASVRGMEARVKIHRRQQSQPINSTSES